MKKLVSLVMVLTLLTCCLTIAEAASMTAYIDELGIQITIPGGTSSGMDDDGFYYIYTHDENSIPYVLIGRYEYDDEDSFLSEFTNMITANYSDLRIAQKEKSVRVGSHSMRQIVYNYSVQGYNVVDTRLAFYFNDSMYMFGSKEIPELGLEVGNLLKDVAGSAILPDDDSDDFDDFDDFNAYYDNVEIDDLEIQISLPENIPTAMKDDGFYYVYTGSEGSIPYVILGRYESNGIDGFFNSFTKMMRNGYSDLSIDESESVVYMGDREVHTVKYGYKVQGYDVEDTRVAFYMNGYVYMLGSKEIPELNMYVGDLLETITASVTVPGSGDTVISGDDTIIPSGSALATAKPAYNAGSNANGDEYCVTSITDDYTGMTVGRAFAPKDYSVTGVTQWCGSMQSVAHPAQVTIGASSPDGNSGMLYISGADYVHLVSQIMNEQEIGQHTDFLFDTSVMTPMLTFMEAEAYCDYVATTVLPNTQLTVLSQADIDSDIKSAMDVEINNLYTQMSEFLSQNTIAGTSSSINGVYCDMADRTYSYEVNGTEYRITVISATEALQMTLGSSSQYLTTSSITTSWSAPFVYAYFSPASEHDQLRAAFDLFSLNTTVSDEFLSACSTLSNQIYKYMVDRSAASMDAVLDYCSSSFESSIGDDASYTTDLWTDYILEQNSYDLDNGESVKVSTAYDYVYADDYGNVYASNSAFDEPAGMSRIYPD